MYASTVYGVVTYTYGIFERQISLKEEEEKDKLVFGWKIEDVGSIWKTGREVFLSKQPVSRMKIRQQYANLSRKL